MTNYKNQIDEVLKDIEKMKSCIFIVSSNVKSNKINKNINNVIENIKKILFNGV